MSNYIELSPSEERIVAELRTLQPFERVEVVADKDGKPGVYFVTRTTKAVLIDGGMNHVK